jgi:UDP-N-acetylglucosamine diphosphorylase/glucosamine-1-phosphate N-acetyltransferase
MRYVLCDPDLREVLYPFSQLRLFAEIRVGLWTTGERYAQYLDKVVVQDRSQIKNEIVIYINASVIPDEKLISKISELKMNEAIAYQNEFVAVCMTGKDFKGFSSFDYDSLEVKQINDPVSILRSPCDIVRFNQKILAEDINGLDRPDAASQLAHENKIIGTGKIIIEEGVNVSGAFLNTESGPIYLGKNVQIMEGVCIRGPVAILEDAVIKMGATIYGATTIGKKCIVGGEIKNSVFFDYSNKAHHGYIGDSVIGSWCNMGAGTSCSNVKNNAGDIYLWNPLLKKPVHVGGKCGVIMGDHSKTAINTSLNSGTVTGICCNIVPDRTVLC